MPSISDLNKPKGAEELTVAQKLVKEGFKQFTMNTLASALAGSSIEDINPELISDEKFTQIFFDEAFKRTISDAKEYYSQKVDKKSEPQHKLNTYNLVLEFLNNPRAASILKKMLTNHKPSLREKEILAYTYSYPKNDQLVDFLIENDFINSNKETQIKIKSMTISPNNKRIAEIVEKALLCQAYIIHIFDVLPSELDEAFNYLSKLEKLIYLEDLEKTNSISQEEKESLKQLSKEYSNNRKNEDINEFDNLEKVLTNKFKNNAVILLNQVRYDLPDAVKNFCDIV